VKGCVGGTCTVAWMAEATYMTILKPKNARVVSISGTT